MSTMAQLIIKKWPFRDSERALLFWMHSPYQTGKDKQWQMTAVFKGEDGT